MPSPTPSDDQTAIMEAPRDDNDANSTHSPFNDNESVDTSPISGNTRSSNVFQPVNLNNYTPVNRNNNTLQISENLLSSYREFSRSSR